jgi:hypothetical protein
MKKLESLKKLLVAVEEAPFMAQQSYCDGTGGHCVVGHLLLQNGVTSEELLILDNHKVSPYQYYGISGIIADIKGEALSFNSHVGSVPREKDFVGRALEQAGFDITDEEDVEALKSLQETNDHYGKAVVIEEIESWIELLEAEAK